MALLLLPKPPKLVSSNDSHRGDITNLISEKT